MESVDTQSLVFAIAFTIIVLFAGVESIKYHIRLNKKTKKVCPCCGSDKEDALEDGISS